MMRISLLGASLLVLLAACCRADDLSTLASADLSTPTPTDVTSPASGFYFGADYLNWAARGAIWTLPSNAAGFKFQVLDSSRNSGVRTEIGYRFASGWDIGYRFTHFDAQSHFDAPPSMNNTGLGVEDGDGSLTYNVNDLEIGRTFNVDTSADFRVFGGLRWALINLTRNTYAPADNVDFPAGILLEDNYSQLDAVGIGFGGLARWRIGDTGLSLFGRGAFYGLAGSMHITDTSIIPYYGYQTISANTTQGILDVEIGAGVGWTKGPWQFEAGYEISEWFNTFSPGSGLSFSGLNNATLPNPQQFSLDGFYLRVMFTR